MMIDSLRRRIGHLNTWGTQTVNRRILVASLTVSGLILLVKVFSAGKEIVVAYFFGASGTLDAFLIAFLLPEFAINVFGESFQTAFTPTFVQLREKKAWENARRLFSTVILCVFGLLVIVAALLALAGPFILPVLGSGFGPEKLSLTRSLLMVLLPVLVLGGLATAWRGALTAQERFGLASLSPGVTPLIVILVLFLFSAKWGIYALAWGVAAGALAEIALLAYGLKRQGLPLLMRWHGLDDSVRDVVRQYWPMIAGALLASGATLVDRAMAAMLGPGSVAVLSYGNRAVATILGLSSGLWVAIFPHFSRLVAVSDWRQVRHAYKTYFRLIVIVSVPVTVVLVVFSTELVRLLFQRGAFTEADTVLVGQVQALYALKIPFYILVVMSQRLLSSLKANRYLMRAAGITLILDVIANYVLMQWMGVAGIALSTVLVYVVSLWYLLVVVLRLLRQAEKRIPLSMSQI